MKSRQWNRLIAGVLIAAPVAHVVRAETFLSEDGAAAQFFPGEKLSAGWQELSPTETKTIESVSGERVTSRRVRVWWGPHREAMIVDRVVGKHQLITFAVGISANGRIKGVEILDYRENYGYEVRRPEWRRQFVGKTVASPLRVNKDIQNISGATLSSTHVTDGVRRVLETYAVLKGRS